MTFFNPEDLFNNTNLDIFQKFMNVSYYTFRNVKFKKKCQNQKKAR